MSETVSETVDWSDQRSALRQRTLKRGRALVNGVEVAEVTVRNMSLTGARLISPDCEGLPDTFTLTVGDEGLTREVEVRSRSATGMGVRFLKPLSTREFGAEFLQASTGEGRERNAAEQRADLLRRAREGLERMDLGFVAPPIAMADPPAAPLEGELSGDGAGATEAWSGKPAADEAADGGTALPDALPHETSDATPDADDVPVDAARAADDVGLPPVDAMRPPSARAADDGLGEGALGRIEPGHPPRAVRRLFPWAA